MKSLNGRLRDEYLNGAPVLDVTEAQAILDQAGDKYHTSP